METEWKRNGKKYRNQVEIKLIGMEWNWNGNGMENFRLKKTTCNGMEMEWKWNGNELGRTMELVWKWNGNGMKMEIYKKFVIELKME